MFQSLAWARIEPLQLNPETAKRLYEIERQSFEKPRTETQFWHFLTSRKNVHRVLSDRRRAGLIVGHISWIIGREFLFLHSIAVDPGCRREGLGSAMIYYLQDRLIHRRVFRVKAIETVVYETDLQMQLFLKANGFRALEIKHYPDVADGYVFSWRPVSSKKEGSLTEWTVN